MKSLSEILSEIEPHDLSMNGGSTVVSSADYDRMKRVAIELSQTLEAIFNSATHPTTVVFIGDAIKRAKEIIGSKE